MILNNNTFKYQLTGDYVLTGLGWLIGIIINPQDLIQFHRSSLTATTLHWQHDYDGEYYRFSYYCPESTSPQHHHRHPQCQLYLKEDLATRSGIGTSGASVLSLQETLF